MTRNVRAAAVAAVVALAVIATPVSAAPRPLQAEERDHQAIATPASFYLFVGAGFRYQDPNYAACTAASVMSMLNFIAYRGTGGDGFRWQPTLSGAKRDQILSWERGHDTLAGGRGTDPHGWRNALNFFGWGEDALRQGNRVYEDRAFGSFDWAIKSSIRAMLEHRKPVGLLAWGGRHSQMLVGYYGLSGDPFEKGRDGVYTNDFSVSGLYLADPLKAQQFVNRRISYASLKTTSNLRLRFRQYWERDSPYDDPYTGGSRVSHNEWYGKYVVVAPVR